MKCRLVRCPQLFISFHDSILCAGDIGAQSIAMNGSIFSTGKSVVASWAISTTEQPH